MNKSQCLVIKNERANEWIDGWKTSSQFSSPIFAYKSNVAKSLQIMAMNGVARSKHQQDEKYLIKFQVETTKIVLAPE